ETSVADAAAGVGVEDVELALLRLDVDRLALPRGAAAVDAGAERLGRLVLDGADLLGALGGAGDVGVGAELLDGVDGDRQTVALGRQLDVLGADAHDDVRAGLGERFTGYGDDGLTELRPAVDHRRGHEVHRRRADEAGDEDVVRVVVHPARG